LAPGLITFREGREKKPPQKTWSKSSEGACLRVFCTEVDMFNQMRLGREFFDGLLQIDEELARQVMKCGCRWCALGRLHRGDFERKPRGALVAPAGEEFVIRFSFCCNREGCRRRTTPPSLRFLGRRVYLGAVVIIAGIVACALGFTAESRQLTGVPARTTRRWRGWWLGPFITTEVFMAVRARLVGVAVDALPASIVSRLPGSEAEQVRAMLQLLAPLTTGQGAGRGTLSEGRPRRAP
jgi:hypothetical protein